MKIESILTPSFLKYNFLFEKSDKLYLNIYFTEKKKRDNKYWFNELLFI